MDLFRIGPDVPDELGNYEFADNMWTLGAYIAEYVSMPEHRRLFIRLGRMMRITGRIGETWRARSREQALAELTEVRKCLHELEAEAEQIDDTILRERVLDWIDVIAGARRSIAEEIRWDVEATKAETATQEA